MSFKIPTMQYDKRVNTKEAISLLDFTERYIKAFQDDMAERTYEKITSTRFLGQGPFKILMKRRENFSDDEIEDPEFFYIQKYKTTISRLASAIESSKLPNTYKLDQGKLGNLLDFFEHQGYLTEKQKGLIFFLLKNYPKKQIIATSLKEKMNSILHHHIKKDFMKAETAVELAEIIADIGTKKVIPKKKMFLSLTQMRSELSN